MAADQKLVSQVANALQMHYYSDPTKGANDHVILKVDADAEAVEDGFADAAMIAAFGDDWNKSVSLKYNGWSDDGMLDLVADYTDDELKSIMSSTFIQKATPKSLMATVSNMTGLVSNVIKDSDLSVAADRLTTLLGPGNSVSTTLSSLDIDAEDEEFPTVVSNLLVAYLADNMENAEDDNNLVGIMTLYAGAFGYAEATGDKAMLDLLDNNLKNISFENLNSDEWFSHVTDGVSALDEKSVDSYNEFLEENLVNDEAALLAMMDGVSQIAGKYTDKDSLSDAGLYSSDAVSGQVNNYINAIKALSAMSVEERADMSNYAEGTVMVCIAADGAVCVVPGVLDQ